MEADTESMFNELKLLSLNREMNRYLAKLNHVHHPLLCMLLMLLLGNCAILTIEMRSGSSQRGGETYLLHSSNILSLSLPFLQTHHNASKFKL